MTSADFLYDLRRRLSRLPRYEAEQAMAYYEEYFAEAGPDGEAELISRLGSPAQVAATIISEYAMKDMSGEASESKKKGNSVKTLWIVLVAVFASPVAIPLALVLVILAFSILITVFALLFSFFATAVSLALGGLFGVAMGIVGLFTQPLDGMAVIGVGCLCVSLGLALFLGTTKLSQLTVKGITWIFARMLGRKGGQR